MTPLWRWMVFMGAFAMDLRTEWRWARRLWVWSIPAGACGEGAACGIEAPWP